MKDILLRVTRTGDEIICYISTDDGKNWITIEEFYGLLGDFDIRYPVDPNLHYPYDWD